MLGSALVKLRVNRFKHLLVITLWVKTFWYWTGARGYPVQYPVQYPIEQKGPHRSIPPVQYPRSIPLFNTLVQYPCSISLFNKYLVSNLDTSCTRRPTHTHTQTHAHTHTHTQSWYMAVYSIIRHCKSSTAVSLPNDSTMTGNQLWKGQLAG